MSPYEALYLSWWNHPLACWISAAVMLLIVARRLSFLPAYLVLNLAITCADAVVSGMWGNMGGQSSALYTPLTFFAIVAGDWRVYWLMRREASADAQHPWGGWQAAAIAFILCFIPSLGVEALGRAFPAAFADSRVLYLSYELLALGMMTALQGIWLGGWLVKRSPGRVAWARRVLAFAQAQYALWALADMVILSGYPQGFLLRIVPNIMYYALFLPVVWSLAPEDVDG